MERKQYVAPKITVYGDAKKITKANQTGSHLDGTFTSGTPMNELTLS
jgi:hypothetical protein